MSTLPFRKENLLKSAGIAAIAFVIAQNNAFAGQLQCRALFTSTSMRVSDYKGLTYFETMTSIVKEQMDNAAMKPFTIVDGVTIKNNLESNVFHPEVKEEILRLFMDSADVKVLRSARTQKDKEKIENTAMLKMMDFMQELAGQEVTIVNLDHLNLKETPPFLLTQILKAADKKGVFNNSRKILNAMNFATFLSINSQGGSRVEINKDNFFVNVGYQMDGVEKNEKSGRSSSRSPEYGYNDASDTYLLKAVDQLLSSTKNQSGHFFGAMMDLLLKSDPEKYNLLTANEQAVLTDFLAVYSAEFRRSLMSDLQSHRWMDDLMETYMISAYGSAAEKVIGEQGFVDGHADTYFAVGANGSGIGVMRKHRYVMQVIVTEAIKKLKPELIEHIDDLMDQANWNHRANDIFHDFALFLNAPENQNQIKEHNGKISQAMTSILDFMGTHHKSITAYIEKNIEQDRFQNKIKSANDILESKRKLKAEKDKQRSR